MGLQPRGRATQLGPSEPDAPGVGDPAHLLATAELQTALLLPFLPLYIIYRNVIAGMGRLGGIRYGSEERCTPPDRFTPRVYVHRHTDAECANGSVSRLSGTSNAPADAVRRLISASGLARLI